MRERTDRPVIDCARRHASRLTSARRPAVGCCWCPLVLRQQCAGLMLPLRRRDYSGTASGDVLGLAWYATVMPSTSFSLRAVPEYLSPSRIRCIVTGRSGGGTLSSPCHNNDHCLRVHPWCVYGHTADCVSEMCAIIVYLVRLRWSTVSP